MERVGTLRLRSAEVEDGSSPPRQSACEARAGRDVDWRGRPRLKKLVWLATALVLALGAALAWWPTERTRGAASAAPTGSAAPRVTPRAALVPADVVTPEEPSSRVRIGDAASGTAESADPGRDGAAADPAPVFLGIVVDARTQRPIAGARVVAARGRREAVADADGRFALVVDEASSLAEVHAESYGRGSVVVDGLHGEPGREALVELLPEAGLEVRARDARGAALADAEVTVVWHAEPMLGSSFVKAGGEHARWSARTDAAGVAFLRGLPAETELDWDVRAGSGAFRDGRLALVGGEVRVLEVALGGGARLAGRALDERGAPVAGLAVQCVRARMLRTHERLTHHVTVTDERGGFAFEDLELDHYALGLPHEVRDFVAAEPGSSVLVDRPSVEHDFHVRRGLFVAGRVEGAPEDVAELFLAFARAVDGGGLHGAAIEDGAFRIGPLAPGSYEVRAVGGPIATDPVRVPAGEEDAVLRTLAPVDVPVRVDGDAETVELVLHDLASGTITAWSEPVGPIALRVPPGEHALVATAAGDRLAFAHLVVEPGSAPREVVLALEPAARLTVVHRAEDRLRGLAVRVGGAPFPTHRGLLGADALLPGGARTVLVPPGAVEAELVEDGRTVARERRVLAPGERARMELEPGR